MNDLIEKISPQIKELYPNVKFRIHGKYEMEILPVDDKGFEIHIVQGERENTIYFGGWHFHFDNTEDGKNELLDYLGFGMSKLGRLKVYSRGGQEYKWTFEIKNEDNGNWYPSGTMATVSLRFWKKKEISYYQNDFIDLEKLERKPE